MTAPARSHADVRPPVTGFNRQDGRLFVDDVPLTEIAAHVGTPTYVYSQTAMEDRYRMLEQAFGDVPVSVCYAVKANSNLAVLRTFAELGAGFDIVSGGELQRVIAAGGDPGQVVFSGIGKTEAEIDFALKNAIRCFNVESASELDRIARRAELLRTRAPVSIRVNPDVDPQTHPYISTGLKNNKFGVPVDAAFDLYRRAAGLAWLELAGIDCHIGSQITRPEPIIDALDSVLGLVKRLRDASIILQHVDLGGGFGVRYRDEPEFDLAAFGRMVLGRLTGERLHLLLEPGRFLVANTGCLLCRVEYLKPRNEPDGKSFAVVDAAMNDLIRPALYQAWHDVELVEPAADRALNDRWDLVGPVCESGDFLAIDRPLALASGELVAVMSAGAYGMVQASNYNSRNRPAEVLVSNDTYHIARRRETVRDQLALESATFANARAAGE